MTAEEMAIVQADPHSVEARGYIRKYCRVAMTEEQHKAMAQEAILMMLKEAKPQPEEKADWAGQEGVPLAATVPQVPVDFMGRYGLTPQQIIDAEPIHPLRWSARRHQTRTVISHGSTSGQIPAPYYQHYVDNCELDEIIDDERDDLDSVDTSTTWDDGVESTQIEGDYINEIEVDNDLDIYRFLYDTARATQYQTIINGRFGVRCQDMASDQNPRWSEYIAYASRAIEDLMSNYPADDRPEPDDME